VNTLARLPSLLAFAALIFPAAVASHMQWYAIALCFFFNSDVGIVAFITGHICFAINQYAQHIFSLLAWIQMLKF
jgi:hypothetical protein